MFQVCWKILIEIKYLFEEWFGVQVWVDNDCVMLVLVEKWQYQGIQQDFCVINVDYGIGLLFVINDYIYCGSLYGSGQIGYMIVNFDGKVCDCGRYGCFEIVVFFSVLKKQV